MSYDLVRNGLVGILNGQALTESSETLNFNDASDNEYGNCFILNCEDGESDNANEEQSSFIYDNQKWTVKVAYAKSSQSSGNQRDEVQRRKDSLLVELDNPENWLSFCTLLRYRRWSIEELDSYYVLNIELKIKDVLTY